jgi:phosphoribosylformylglycinamidine cyclo-ligase
MANARMRKAAVHTDYASAGVNVQFGNVASKMLYEAAKQTWANRSGKLGEIVEVFRDFSGVRGIHVGELPKGTFLGYNLDGVGTKVEVFERLGRHETAAYDLFAMPCDDCVRNGTEPVLFGSVLDVKSLGKKDVPYTEFMQQLAAGYVNAAKAADVAVINGEIAELGYRVNGYGEFNYNWSAGVVWFARKERVITGHKVSEGDWLVGLREFGFRSNGLSLTRKILEKVHGDEWHMKKMPGSEKSLGELVQHPSTIYTKAAVEMFGGVFGERKVEIHGIAHITGGGIPEKLGRMLRPSGLGAYISSPFTPPEIVLYVQEKGNVRESEAYGTWNMGQGMVIATPDPVRVGEIAEGHGIEAKVIGRVIKPPRIIIESKGAFGHRTQKIEFPVMH